MDDGVFGGVADVYDDVRPGYPASIAQALMQALGEPPAQVVEIGAGTGDPDQRRQILQARQTHGLGSGERPALWMESELQQSG